MNIKYYFKVAFLFGAYILLTSNTFSQNNKYSCTTSESHQFDFWIGNWELTWNDTSQGTNFISKEYESCVIHERFADSLGKFFGQSFSVYNSKKKLWEQTWVDNQNSYMTFRGELINNEMILNLITDEEQNTKRMRFTNIAQNSFDWYWEILKDDKSTWSTLWLIHYDRKSTN